MSPVSPGAAQGSGTAPVPPGGPQLAAVPVPSVPGAMGATCRAQLPPCLGHSQPGTHFFKAQSCCWTGIGDFGGVWARLCWKPRGCSCLGTRHISSLCAWERAQRSRPLGECHCPQGCGRSHQPCPLAQPGPSQALLARGNHPWRGAAGKATTDLFRKPSSVPAGRAGVTLSSWPGDSTQLLFQRSGPCGRCGTTPLPAPGCHTPAR